MCGRYYIDDKYIDELKDALEQMKIEVSEGMFGQLSPRDIHPTEVAPIIYGTKSIKLDQMRWGFKSDNGLLINARSESAADKKSFADSIQHRRCIIPASGFYEWDHDKNKVTFNIPNKLLYMAGLYRPAEDHPEFVILTTAANDSMKRTHDRMPCFIDENEIERWITDGTSTNKLLNKSQPMLNHSQSYEQLSLF